MGVPSSVVVTGEEIQRFTDAIKANYTSDQIKTALKLVKTGTPNLRQYRDDPAGFGMDILGEYFTPGIVNVMESVRDNRITIARSANQIGKSHGAARVATAMRAQVPMTSPSV